MSKFYFDIVNHETKYPGNTKNLIKEHMQNLPDGEYEIAIQRVPKHEVCRSTKQNAYYWGVVLGEITEPTGHTAEELHEAFKAEFLTIDKMHGLRIIGSTTDITTMAFEDYLRKIRDFASSNLGVYIPKPNEVNLQW